jgi:menaquinone-9 beta-reductase
MNSFDVAIVGASIAGSCAALRLSKANLRVALIDKAAFPRRKPCGEGLANYGLKQFKKLGLEDVIADLPHSSLPRFDIKIGHKIYSMRAPHEKGIFIERLKLDLALFEEAIKQPNVTHFLKCPVSEISENRLKIGGEFLKAKKIIVACGGGSSLLKKIPLKMKRRGQIRTGGSIVYIGSFNQKNEHALISLKNDYELYCTPLPNGRLNVAVLIDEQSSIKVNRILKDKESIGELFKELGFQGEPECLPVGRANLGNVKRLSLATDIILAGDASEEFDPVGGMGMSHAVVSGIIAAEQIIYSYDKSSTNNLLNLKEAQGAISNMRRFTALTYRCFKIARYYPNFLTALNSPLGSKITAHLTQKLN